MEALTADSGQFIESSVGSGASSDSVEFCASILDGIPKGDSYLHLRHSPITVTIEMMLMNREIRQLKPVLERLRTAIVGRQCGTCSVQATETDLNTFHDKHKDRRSLSAECVNRVLLTYAEHSLDVPLAKVETNNRQSFRIPDRVPLKVEWIPDNEAELCMCCQEARFTSTQRRHHCRRCGRIVCGACSKWKKKILHSYKNRPVRHCDDCLGLITPKSADPDPADAVMYWKLSGEPSDCAVRKDYWNTTRDADVEYCLAILDLVDEDCEAFLRTQCRKFEDLIRGHHSQGMDFKMLTQTLYCLTAALKVRCPFNTDWDLLLAKVQIMKKLANLNLVKLIPAEPLSLIESLKKLRDNLLSAGMFTMAFDASLLSGLSTCPVLLAWGIECLRLSNHFLAREKLSQIGHRIVSCNEADNWSRDVSVERKYPDGLRKPRIRPKETPPTALEIIKLLEEKYDVDWEQETFYYLFLFGSHRDILSYMIRIRCWPVAFRYILDQSVEFEDFLDAVILSSNEITEFDLIMLMRGSDPGLEQWESYLNKLLTLYERKNILATIYNLQAALGDDLRAGLTCIKFFTNNCSNYSCFLSNLHYLENAEFHFKRDLKKKHHLQLTAGLKVPKRSTKLVWDSRKINSYLKAIALQKKISRFVAEFEDGTNLLDTVQRFSGLDRPVAIFDHQHMSLMVLIVTCDISRGYELACEILSSFASSHRMVELHQSLIDYFAVSGSSDLAIQFVDYVTARGDSQEDELDACILTAVRKLDDKDHGGAIPKLIQAIRNPHQRWVTFMFVD